MKKMAGGSLQIRLGHALSLVCKFQGKSSTDFRLKLGSDSAGK